MVLRVRLLALSLLLVLLACEGKDNPRIAAPTEPEDPVEWLEAMSVPLATVDPDSQDFADLQPLKEILAGKTLVLLGEPSHGDGTTFLAKTRLIEFLHQEMGFDVLAFESGLYDCRKSWQQLLGGMDALESISGGVFSIWTLSEQVQPLVEYWGASAQGAPLELAGFDCQFTASNSGNYLVADLEAHLRAIASPILEHPLWFGHKMTLLNLSRNYYYTGVIPSELQQLTFFSLQDSLETALTEPADDPMPEETAFWKQMVRSIRTQARFMWTMDWDDIDATPDSVRNLRDRQMAENLVWLSEEAYPGRKIVVWAATFHNARELSTIEVPAMPGLYEGTVPMGQLVSEELGDAMYAIGFTASQGEVGTVFMEPWTLPAPSEGSLEDLLGRTTLDHTFVDFSGLSAGGAWLREPLESWPLGYQPMVADWTRVMDGLVYTRSMVPSRLVAGKLTASVVPPLSPADGMGATLR